ncbi:hypothetical protein Hanom_Chr15g01356111 [Helianthus anomalus]
MAKPKLMPPTQAPPYPMGVGLSGGGAPIPHVNQCPNPSPTIPHGLIRAHMIELLEGT